MATTASTHPDLQELERGKRRRQRQEAILAILFVLPATVVTFMFMIWPVIFGFYVSLHQWRARTNSFLGLDQYVRTLGNAAYALAFFLVILFLFGGYRALRKTYATMQEGKGSFLPYIVPGFILGLGTIVFALGALGTVGGGTWGDGLRPLVLWGAVLLAVGGGLTVFVNGRVEQSSETSYAVQLWQVSVMWVMAVGLFLFTIAEIQANSQLVFDLVGTLAPDQYVPPLMEQLWLGALLVVSVLGVYAVRYLRDRWPDDYAYDRYRSVAQILLIVLYIAIIASMLYMIATFQWTTAAAGTVHDLERGDVAAVGQELTGLDRNGFRAEYGSPDGQDLANMLVAWPQVIAVAIGFFMFYLAYRMWRGASKAETAMGAGRLVLLAIVVAIAGWLLLTQLPAAMGTGDADYYQSLLITATYSIGTVPFQLGLGLFLAYIMFYEINIGKSAYRMVYFMSYIAPTVATATVFSIIFSPRPYSLSNQLIGLVGMEPLAWLQESRGIFEIFAERTFGPEFVLPGFLVGPSLALIAIIIYNIWVFAGYNAVIFLAGLGAIPGELYEAAKVDGAGRWKAFRHITFPLLSPTTFFLLVLSISGTFRAFSHIYVMRQPAARGTADTASVHIFVQFWQFNQWGYASAMAFVLFGVILILTLVQNQASKGRVFYG